MATQEPSAVRSYGNGKATLPCRLTRLKGGDVTQLLFRKTRQKSQKKQGFQRASPLPQEFLKNFSTQLNKV